MKKIYSFVLMAAMLLIGTNVKAATVVTEDNLQTLIDAAEDGAEFVINSTFETQKPLWLGNGKHIILTLNANYVYSGAKTVAIAVTHGTLEIRGTKKIQATSTVEDLIRVYGTTDELDAKNAENAYSRIILNHGAKLQSTKNVISVDVMRPGQGTLFGRSDADFDYTCVVNNNASKYGLANGVRIDVEGSIEAEKYGIKVNGMVRDPKEFGMEESKRQFTPFIYIHDNAIVTTNDANTNAVAAYSSGYARWRIEGECTGSTGLYAKSGDVEIVGGTIASNSSYNPPASTGSSGVQASGSAIVIESNDKYSGNISVTIAGDAHIEATTGYAIQETLINGTSDEGTKVENITVVSGEIVGGNKGAIIVTPETVTDSEAQVVILGGQISSTDEDGKPLQIEGSDASESAIINQLIPNGYNGDVPEPETSGQTTSLVIKTGYLITLNNEGLATFSAAEKTIIPSGLQVYKAQFNGFTENLELIEITDNAYLAAATGVIVYGTPNESYNMVIKNDASAPAVTENKLHAQSEWFSRNQSLDFYVLSGNMMYKYTGSTMPANKAYLQIDGGNATAPARIQMVFAETQDVENIEAGVKAEKFIENGQVLIKRGEKVYNVQGQIVK